MHPHRNALVQSRSTCNYSHDALSKHHGYTLLETVISLALLISVVVPLTTRFYRSASIHDSRRELTGIWLIEQEAALLRTFPKVTLPVKRRSIDGQEWTIRTGVTESEPLRYYLTAELGGVVKADAHFFGRAENDE